MTLNQIVDDILLTCAYIDKEKTDKLLRKQVEAWIHQYRVLLMKQDISKNSVVDPTYITYKGFSFRDIGANSEMFENMFGQNIIKAVYPYKRGFYYLSEQELPELAPLIGRVGIVSAQAYNVASIGETADTEQTFNIPVHVCDISRTFYGGYSKWSRNSLTLSVFEKKLMLFSYRRDPLDFVMQNHMTEVGVHRMNVLCGLIVANPDVDPQNTMGENRVNFRDREYPMPDDRIPRLKQMIYANELQWVFPARDTAQSGQMAKLEEQELKNNPEHLMQAGADLYDGYD